MMPEEEKLRQIIKNMQEGDRLEQYGITLFDGVISETYAFGESARIAEVAERSPSGRKDRSKTRHITQKQLLKILLDYPYQIAFFESKKNEKNFGYKFPLVIPSLSSSPLSVIGVKYVRAGFLGSYEVHRLLNSTMASEIPERTAREKIREFGEDFKFYRNYFDKIGLIIDVYFEKDGKHGYALAYGQVYDKDGRRINISQKDIKASHFDVFNNL